MSIKKEEGILLVDYPDFLDNTTNGVLEIKWVKCTPHATTVRFKAYYTPNYWIRLSESSTLKTVDGKQYQVLNAEGITLGKEFYMPESGEAEFTLTFQPLPMDTKTFSFQEGNKQGDWRIEDVRLVLGE